MMPMRLPLLLIPLMLALSACSGRVDPKRDYYVLNHVYVSGLNVANDFVQDCVKKQPADHPCHDAVPPIQSAVKVTKQVFLQADKVFVTKDSKYYNLSLSVASGAREEVHAPAYPPRLAKRWPCLISFNFCSPI
jgi:hypothetical protein